MNLNKGGNLLSICERLDIAKVAKDPILCPSFYTSFFPGFSFGHFVGGLAPQLAILWESSAEFRGL